MTAAALIELQDLSKNYCSKTAVDHVSLHIFDWQVFGFLALNGVDKTTTIKLLFGHAPPTGGSAHIFGYDIQQESIFIHNRIGQPLTSVTPIIYITLMCLVFTMMIILHFQHEEF